MFESHPQYPYFKIILIYILNRACVQFPVNELKFEEYFGEVPFKIFSLKEIEWVNEFISTKLEKLTGFREEVMKQFGVSCPPMQQDALLEALLIKAFNEKDISVNCHGDIIEHCLLNADESKNDWLMFVALFNVGLLNPADLYSANIFNKKPLLFLLADSNIFCDAIKILLLNNSNLKIQLAEGLLQNIKEREITLPYSTFYLLSTIPEGINLLLQLSSLLENLPKLISPTLLFTEVPSIEMAGDSIFNQLCADYKGRHLLKYLFEANPSLLSAITIEDLSREVKQGALQGLTPLDWLCNSSLGVELLAMIFTANPSLKENIPAQTFLKRKYTLDFAGRSPFFGLCRLELGHQILNDLINTNHIFLETIDKTDLDNRVKNNFNHGISPRILLRKTATGKSILTQIAAPSSREVIFNNMSSYFSKKRQHEAEQEYCFKQLRCQ